MKVRISILRRARSLREGGDGAWWNQKYWPGEKKYWDGGKPLKLFLGGPELRFLIDND